MLKRLFSAALGLVWIVFAVGCTPSRQESLSPTFTAVSVSPSTLIQTQQDPPSMAGPTRASPAPVSVTTMPTAATPVLDSACLVGMWEAADLPHAMAESFRDTTTGLALQGVDGRVLYHFEADGRLTIDFDRLTATLAGTLDERPVTAQQILHGQATARYHVLAQEEEVVLSSFGGEGILFTLDINNQRLAEGNLPAWRAFTNTLSDGSALTPGPLMEQTRAEITCEGNQLTLRTIDPNTGPQVVLRRMP